MSDFSNCWVRGISHDRKVSGVERIIWAMASRFERLGTLLASLSFMVAVTSAAEPLPTRLAIESDPPGAKVIRDGTELGETNGLFVVAPGETTIEVKLPGYEPVRRTVKIVAADVTSLTFALHPEQKQGNPATSPSADGIASTIALRYLERSDKLTGDLRDAMLTVIRQHPGLTRWCGRSGHVLFGVAVQPLPNGEIRARATPLVLSSVRSQAAQEVLNSASLPEQYASAGLTDATTLRQAVAMASGGLNVEGRVQGVISLSAIAGDFAVGYVVAEEQDLRAYLVAPAPLDQVKSAYREVLHQQARELMAHNDWGNAILLWHHLHTRRLVSQSLYLDAALCFRELGQTEDAVRVLGEAVQAFQQIASADFFERAGDIAIQIKTHEAQELAEQAYTLATQRLLHPLNSQGHSDGDRFERPKNEQSF
jgi:hypothetical protein